MWDLARDVTKENCDCIDVVIFLSGNATSLLFFCVTWVQCCGEYYLLVQVSVSVKLCVCVCVCVCVCE